MADHTADPVAHAVKTGEKYAKMADDWERSHTIQAKALSFGVEVVAIALGGTIAVTAAHYLTRPKTKVLPATK